MSFQQLVQPNPDISCQPGWCLQYVRQAFGAPVVEPTATAGWNNAKHRHEDWNFPDGCWVPVWFSLATEPAGHVALLAPDGSVYSTSDDSTVPHHHPNMQDLIRYYWRNPLTYLGWSEDISGVRVVQEFNIQSQSESITPLEEDMPITDQDAAKIASAVVSYNINQEGGTPGQINLGAALAWYNANNKAVIDGINGQIVATGSELTDALKKTAPADLASQINAAGVAAQVRDELVKLLGGK